MSCQLYRHHDATGALLYVGVSGNSAARTAQHAHTSNWFLRIKTITVEHFANRATALEAERNAIQKERPPFNRQHLVKEKPPYILPYKIRPEQVRINRINAERIKPRAERIVRLRAAGETLQTIATLLGISRERVRQIEAREARRKRNGKSK